MLKTRRLLLSPKDASLFSSVLSARPFASLIPLGPVEPARTAGTNRRSRRFHVNTRPLETALRPWEQPRGSYLHKGTRTRPPNLSVCPRLLVLLRRRLCIKKLRVWVFVESSLCTCQRNNTFSRTVDVAHDVKRGCSMEGMTARGWNAQRRKGRLVAPHR